MAVIWVTGGLHLGGIGWGPDIWVLLVSIEHGLVIDSGLKGSPVLCEHVNHFGGTVNGDGGSEISSLSILDVVDFPSSSS